MIEGLLIWLAAIIATEAIVELIVASKIFFGLRDWIARYCWAWLGELVNCGYCTSVWIASLLFSFYLPVGSWLEGVCRSHFFAWLIVLVGKAAIVHRMSNVMHEKFSRWFHKHKFGVEVVHINVGQPDGQTQSHSAREGNSKKQGAARRRPRSVH